MKKRLKIEKRVRVWRAWIAAWIAPTPAQRANFDLVTEEKGDSALGRQLLENWSSSNGSDARERDASDLARWFSGL